MSSPRSEEPKAPKARIIKTLGTMLALLFSGVPIAFVDWRIFDEALAGRFHFQAIVEAVLLAIIFLVCAWLLGRRMRALVDVRA